MGKSGSHGCIAFLITSKPKKTEKLVTGAVCAFLAARKVRFHSKLLYGLNDWGGYILPNENRFRYSDLIKYEQYSIFEANFGFNVGSEAGGLHYGVIIDKENTNTRGSLRAALFCFIGNCSNFYNYSILILWFDRG